MSEPEPAVPHFDLALHRGEARLRTRRPLRLELGTLEALELVAAELGSPLDLRAGAMALRDRRTHAVAACVSLPVRRMEQALRALGLPTGIHAGAACQEGVFGATLWLENGPVDCEVLGVLDAGVLTLRLERFDGLLLGSGLVEVCGSALRQLECAFANRGTPLRVALEEHAQRLTVTIDHALEHLLAGGLLAGGWRLPRTRGLTGTLRWSEKGERGEATLTLQANEVAPPESTALGSSRSTGLVEDSGSERQRPHESARRRLAEVLSHSPREALDVEHTKRVFEEYARLDPSALMRADAALSLAELLTACEVAGDAAGVDADITSLALRALGGAGRSPNVASRVLGLALRSRVGTRDRALLAALLASALPAAQQAALITDAIPELAHESPARARAWLEQVRPFAGDIPQLRVAEAALRDAEGARERAPESLAHAQERAAKALSVEGRREQAASAFAAAARSFQQARDAESAARCWVASVTSVPGEMLELEWIIPGASALQLGGRTQDALALLGTLLTRDALEHPEALAQALEAAARLHDALPASMGSPELFLARRRDLIRR